MNRLILLIFTGLHFFSLASAQEPVPKPTPITLYVGQIKTLEESVISHNGIRLGNPAVLAVTLNPIEKSNHTQIDITPIKKGTSTLILRDKSGAIAASYLFQVLNFDPNALESRLNKTLDGIHGLRIYSEGENEVIDGKIDSIEDYGRIVHVISQGGFHGQVMNLVTLSQQFYSNLAKKMEAEIEKFAPQTTVRALDSALILEGTVDNKEVADRALKMGTFMIPSVIPGNAVEDDPNAMTLAPRAFVQSFIQVKANAADPR